MPAQEWLVACLCAEWCGSCRDYRAVFARAAAGAVPGVRFAWIDIEDQPEVMGEIEVEDFPTLLIANASGVAFFGAVTPHAATLERLVERGVRGELTPLEDEAVRALAARARAAVAG